MTTNDVIVKQACWMLTFINTVLVWCVTLFERRSISDVINDGVNLNPNRLKFMSRSILENHKSLFKSPSYIP